MTNKELEKKIKELSAQIDALKGELKEETPKGEIWKPEEGEACWTVGKYGNVFKEYGNTLLIENGNCYPTEKKAQFEAQREKYTRLFRQYVEQHSEPLDWSDVRQEKWYVFYDWELKRICFNYICGEQGMEVYGSSEEVMQDAIDFVGRENYLRYVLGVQDE